MATDFNAQTVSIGQMLGADNKARILVPTFQRGYSWQTKHVAAFWKDITDFQNDETREKHFLGPIVTLAKSRDITEILDGQQRLATATILFSVLRDVADGLGTSESAESAKDIQKQLILKEDTLEFALEMGDTDSIYFKETIQSFPPNKKTPTLASHTKISGAQNFLMTSVKNYIGTAPPGSALNLLLSLKRTLRSELVMTCIPVASDQDAFWIFETLNDRGLRLSVPDLLLNYLMRVAKQKVDRPHIRRLWNEMLDRMGKRNITKFLQHLWKSRYGDLKDQGLFAALKADIEHTRINSLTFARTVAADCESYVELLDGKKSDLGDAAVYVQRIKDLEVQPAWPLLLAGYQQFEKQEFSRIAQWILVFVVKYSIIGQLDPSGLETLFFEQARKIRAVDNKDKKSVRVCMGEIKDNLARKTPTEPQLRASMTTLAFSCSSDAAYMLNRLANRMQSSTKELALGEANIEHIFPKNPKDHEWGGKTNHAVLLPCLWHIGNLTMLGKKINSGAGNEEFAVKRVRYEERSELSMARRVAEEYKGPVWDKATIEKRATSLAKLVLEVWNFDNPSRV